MRNCIALCLFFLGCGPGDPAPDVDAGDAVVCRVSPVESYTGCNGEAFEGYDIFWDAAPYVCTGNPLERATCPTGMKCIVVLKPSAGQIDGVCE